MLHRLRLACLAPIAALAVAAAACSSRPAGEGGEGQRCFRNGTCDTGLVCLSMLCVRPPDGGFGGGGRGGTTGGGGAGGITGAGGSVGGTGTTAGTTGSAGATAGSGGTTAGSAGSGGSTGGGTAGTGTAGRGIAGTGVGGTGRGGSTGAGGTVNVANCGNRVLDPGESCDDGNRTPGDGCSAICQIPAGWNCVGIPSVCIMAGLCGDGVPGAGEACDDGNRTAGDGCSSDCRTVEPGYECRVPGRACVPFCGDRIRTGAEGCDDGNTTPGDGCSPVCQVEPGASCTTLPPGPSICTASVCGNGLKESNEGCDCGTSTNPPYPVGCQGPNGVFFGDATGCSKTCNKEPACRTGTTTRACDVSCGNGSIELGEGCDDGNGNPGDGCSPTCQVEGGFACAPELRENTAPCTQPGNSGQCVQLPIIYRDFRNESVSGGHPDFFYLGATVANPVTISGVQGQAASIDFNKRFCIPNTGGPAKKADATNRCWDLAMPNLAPNGKPAFNATRTGGTNCDCQFIDWSHDTNNARVPGYTQAANGPTFGITYVDGALGHPMYRGPAPIVTGATTFAQWWVDSTYTGNTHTIGTLELGALGAGQYRYASQVNAVTGGFFPLDPPGQFPLYGVAAAGPGAIRMVGTEALQCNIWPYWYSSVQFGAGNSCRGDQYLSPPGLIPPDTATNCPNGTNCSGKWYVGLQGWFHNSWFTDEARILFTHTGSPFSLQFAGDDDTFVFINGVLVIDLGGIHQRLPGRVDVSASGLATIIEGGSLDASGTNILPCPSADPYTGLMFNNTTNTDGFAHANCTTANCDCRTRMVDLGLQLGRTYEIAVFGADRHPTESNYQITLSGLRTNRSNCMPRCGDAIRTGAEQCDCGDGAAVSTDPSCAGMANIGAYGGCTSQCRFAAYCGDGYIDDVNGNEQCDFGRNNTATYGSMNGCAAGCLYPHYCGDAIVDEAEGEQCDLGPNNGVGSPCSATCRLTLP